MVGFTTSDAPWWTSSVVYQIYPRSFADSNGDGIGDLPGITSKVDHLHRLGVEVVWLSPIYRSPQDDNGYDISDYQDIDPAFGTLADLDVLMDELHRRDMKLVMDLVVNHTSDEHPWFVESRSSKDNPKRDWYWWRTPKHGMTGGQPGAEPNNWTSYFSGSTWEWDEATGEYYLHLFSRKQPDLNWENVEVRQAVYSMMNWWLDRGVDGFRMDVIDMISKQPGLPDGGFERYTNGPRLHSFLQEMHQAVFAGRSKRYITVGETPGANVRQAQLFSDPARHEVDMVFQFDHMGVDRGANKFDPRPFELQKLRTCFRRWQEGLADVGWNSLYWNNHDQPRVVSRFGDDGVHRVASAKMLGTVLHLHRGTPYVYQGEEIGMTNVPFERLEDFDDIETLGFARTAMAGGATFEELLPGLRHSSRDNARTPMQWDDSPNAGFTTGTPWLRVNPNYPQINAAAAVADEDSVFHHYRKLIELRKTMPVIALGDFTMLLDGHPHVYGFTRSLDGEELLVLGNFSGDEQTVDLPEGWDGTELVLGNLPEEGRPAATGTLRPWEARIHRRVR